VVKRVGTFKTQAGEVVTEDVVINDGALVTAFTTNRYLRLPTLIIATDVLVPSVRKFLFNSFKGLPFLRRSEFHAALGAPSVVLREKLAPRCRELFSTSATKSQRFSSSYIFG